MNPHVLLPYQQRWLGDEANVAVWEKSRRIGASWCDSADSVLRSAATNGQDSLYIGYNKDMAREYVEDAAGWAKHFNLAAEAVNEEIYNDVDKDIQAFRINFSSGAKLLCLSSRPRDIRGKQGKITIDEAAFHDDLQGLLKAALAMLIWGGRVRVLSTHNGDENPFNLLLKDIRAGKLPYSLHRTTFTDAVSAGLYRRVCLVQGIEWTPEGERAWIDEIYDQYGDNAAEELDCIAKGGSGTYFPRILVERCQSPDIPVIRLAKPADWYLDPERLAWTDQWIQDTLKPLVDAMDPALRSVLGGDFGRTGDLSVYWPMRRATPIQWKTPFLLEMRRIPFDVQLKILFWILDNVPHLFHAKLDGRNLGAPLAEAAIQRYGEHRVEAVMATPRWYNEQFPAYRSAYEDGSIVVPATEDLITDHRRVILYKGMPRIDEPDSKGGTVQRRDKGSDGEWRHADSAVAGVMAWAATREEGGPSVGVSVDIDDSEFLPDAYKNRRRAVMGWR